MQAPTATRRPHDRLLAFAAAIGVALAATIPFLPALRAPFSDFDDAGFLLEVDGWRGLGPSNLAWMFSTFHRGHYQPLTYLSYAIDHALFGLQPAAFHATNIALHAAGALLVFLLIRRVLSLEARRAAVPPADAARTAIAALAAAAWAAHPLRVESVAWITERRDVLSTALLVGAALAYLRHGDSAERPMRGRWWWTCIALLALSLLAKAWGITFAAVALLLDVRPLRRLAAPAESRPADQPLRLVLLEKLPLAALGLAAAVLAAGAQTERAARSLADWSLLDRLLQAAYGLYFYIDRTLVPRALAPLYETPASLDPSDPRWLVPLLVVVVAGATILAMVRRWTGLAVALACYAVILAPVLGLFQSGMQLVADRYAHVATIPLFTSAAAAAMRLVARPRRRVVTATVAAAVTAIACLGALSWRQATLWQDDARLWQAAIDRGVDGPVLRHHYAAHLEGRGRLADAEANYRKSLRLDPAFSEAWFGLGSVLLKQQRPADAEEPLQHAARTAADPAPALMMLGILYVAHLDRPDAALAAFRAAVEVTEARGNPARTGRPYLLLAAALGQSGDEAAAVPLLRKAAQFPDSRAEAESHLRDLGLAP
jgi:tetratricopeptide (TPR) repeat protein